jgi:acetyl-CoA C-acetyltransferase/acetyl-CoA acyltransferase
VPSEPTNVPRRRVAILGGVRTPFVKSGTAFENASAVELGVRAAVECLARFDLPPEVVDEAVFGNAAQPANAPNIARVIALRAGLPVSTPAFTVHRNCASGLEAITTAYEKIRSGSAGVILAGGVESMSQIPVFFSRAYQKKLFGLARAKTLTRKAAALLRFRPRDFKPLIGLEVGLTDPVCGLNMGETAENLAREFGIAREEQDAFALESHRRAGAAIDAGVFRDEVFPVHAPPAYEQVAADVGPRREQTIEALARLKPYFDRRHGTVTVGNACPVTDGACVLLIAGEERARALGIEPLGWIRDYAYAGCPPGRMGLGPVFAAARVLEKTGLSMEDLDRIEINEAFAAQVLACEKAFASEAFARAELGRERPLGRLDLTRSNVNGGAIALGHPVGATGARLALTLLLELRRRQLDRGLATLCIGGGQGGALVLERGEPRPAGEVAA